MQLFILVFSLTMYSNIYLLHWIFIQIFNLTIYSLFISLTIYSNIYVCHWLFIQIFNLTIYSNSQWNQHAASDWVNLVFGVVCVLRNAPICTKDRRRVICTQSWFMFWVRFLTDSDLSSNKVLGGPLCKCCSRRWSQRTSKKWWNKEQQEGEK